MPSFLDNLPYWLAVAVLFAMAMARGQMMYWLGRGVTESALRTSRKHRAAEAAANGVPSDDDACEAPVVRTGPLRKTMLWLDRGGADPGVRAIHRWGLVMVPISYFTVGFQSMVQAGAGILRISAWKYAIAQIPGAIVWGLFYATGGFLLWKYLFTQAGTHPVRAVVLAGIVAAAVYGVVRYRRSRPEKCPIPGISPGDAANPTTNPGLTPGAGPASQPTPR